MLGLLSCATLPAFVRCQGSNPGLLVMPGKLSITQAPLVLRDQTRTHSQAFQTQTKPSAWSFTCLAALDGFPEARLFCLDQHPEMDRGASWEDAQMGRGRSLIHVPSVPDSVITHCLLHGKVWFQSSVPLHSITCSSEDGKHIVMWEATWYKLIL